MGGDLFAKHRGKRRGDQERGREEVWLRVLPHLKTPGGPRWWWWTRLALHRSDACLLFVPLFASLPLPLPASSHPFLTLLPEFYSNPQRDHRPLAPVTKEEGKFQPVLSAAAGGAGGEGGPRKAPHNQWRWAGENQFPSQQHKYTIVLIPVWLTDWLSTCPSLAPSLSVSLCRSLAVSVCLWVPIRPVGPHFSCLSAPPALTAGRSQGGWDRWSMSYWQEWLKAARPPLWRVLPHDANISSVLIGLMLSFR